MPDLASTNRSLNTVRTELEYLRDSGVLNPAQFQSITAQLPQQNGQPSPYIDPRYAPSAGGGQPANVFDPSAIAQASQNPQNPANPNHPHHAEWARKLGSKFGNAFVFGAGATAGGDLINSVLH